MPGVLYQYLSGDHGRLDALLERAVAKPGVIDNEPYAKFREVLLRHISMEEKIEQRLFKKYDPISVVVNTEGEIVYVNGRTGPYLNLVDGHTSLNILTMIEEAVRAELAGALLESATSRTDIVLPPHRITINGTRKRVVLHVSPLSRPLNHCSLNSSE